MVYFSSLVFPVEACKGFQPDEEVVKDSRIGVHSTVQEPDFDIIGIYLTQPHFQLRELLFAQFPSR